MRILELFTNPYSKLSSGRFISIFSFICAIILIIIDILLKNLNISSYILALLGIAGGLKVMDRVPKSEDATNGIKFDDNNLKGSNK